MAHGNRIVKVSVFKDQKLVDEATFDKDEILVGAFARADLRLDDDAVERRHLVLRFASDGGLSVENLAGPGRMTLNGADVEKTAALKSGDQIVAGPFKLLLSLREPGASDGVSGFYERREEKPEEGGKRALEVAMFWEGALLAVSHYTKQERVTIGERKGATYFTPEERIGTDLYELIVPRDGHFAVNLSNPKIDGDVLIRDKIYTVTELKAAGLLTDGKMLVLDSHTRCRLTLGTIAFLLSYTVLPAKPKSKVFAHMNLQEHIYTSLSLIAHVLFMIILSLIPEEQLIAQRDPSRSRNRTFQVLKMAQEERTPDKEEVKEEEKKEEEEKEKGKEEKEGTQQEEEVKEEEVVAKPNPVKDTTRRESDEMVTRLSPTKVREYNKQVALSTGVSKVFDQQTDLVQQFTGGGAGLWGGRTRGLRVIMSAGGAGDMAAGGFWTGSGGLDPFGGSTGGPGGGGFMGTALASTVGGPAGPGTEDIAGLGKEDARDGTGGIKLSDRAQKVVVTSAEVDISGGLDKDTIQRYIRSKMGQIRWCYKNELQKDRDLKGKITVEFVIAPTGKVMSAKIAGSTMGNKEVESCITQKVAMWRFPASKQGAAAKVRYPFIFKAL